MIDLHGLASVRADEDARFVAVNPRSQAASATRAPTPPHNGSEARAAMKPGPESLLHLMLLNRGSLLAPFHNMMLISPVTSQAAVVRLVANLDDCVQTLSGRTS